MSVFIDGAASSPSMLNALLNGHAKARSAGQRADANAKNGAVEKNRLPAVAVDDIIKAALDSYLPQSIDLRFAPLLNDHLAYTHAVGEHSVKVDADAWMGVILTGTLLSNKGEFVFRIKVGDARRRLVAGVPLLLIGFEVIGRRDAPDVAPAVAWLLRGADGVDALAGQDGRWHACFPRHAALVHRRDHRGTTRLPPWTAALSWRATCEPRCSRSGSLRSPRFAPRQSRAPPSVATETPRKSLFVTSMTITRAIQCKIDRRTDMQKAERRTF